MSSNEQNAPIMDGSTEATDEEKRKGLQEQVDFDTQNAGKATASEELEKRLEQTGLDDGTDPNQSDPHQSDPTALSDS